MGPVWLALLLILQWFCLSSAELGVKPRVLVLGGSGFVGSRFIEKAADRFDIISVSRRGKPVTYTGSETPCWLKVDATDSESLDEVFQSYGPFDACFHSIGLLLDSDSGLKSFNKFASGSGSIPSDRATYDDVTRVTSFNAIDSFLYRGISRVEENNNKPFIFISAAEVEDTH